MATGTVLHGVQLPDENVIRQRIEAIDRECRELRALLRLVIRIDRAQQRTAAVPAPQVARPAGEVAHA